MNALTKFSGVSKTNKPIIAMAYLLPLPGSPLYDTERVRTAR
jgi:predicted TIM-barrel enzyme